MHKINIISSFIIKSRHKNSLATMSWIVLPRSILPQSHGWLWLRTTNQKSLASKNRHTEFSTSTQMLPEAATFHLPIFQLPTQTQSRLQPQQYQQPLKQTSLAPRALGCPLQAQVKLAFSTMPEAKVWTLKQVLISLIISQPVSENAENARVTHYMTDTNHHMMTL